MSLGMAKGWQKDRLRIQMAASKLNWNWLDLGAEMTLSTKTLNSNHQVVWQDGLLLTYCKDPQRSAQIATEKSDYFWMSRKIQLTINPMCSMYGIGAYGIGRTSRKMRRTSKNSSNIMTWRSGFIYNSSFYLCVCILKIVHIKEKMCHRVPISSLTYHWYWLAQCIDIQPLAETTRTLQTKMTTHESRNMTKQWRQNDNTHKRHTHDNKITTTIQNMNTTKQEWEMTKPNDNKIAKQWQTIFNNP